MLHFTWVEWPLWIEIGQNWIPEIMIKGRKVRIGKEQSGDDDANDDDDDEC